MRMMHENIVKSAMPPYDKFYGTVSFDSGQ